VPYGLGSVSNRERKNNGSFIKSKLSNITSFVKFSLSDPEGCRSPPS
jgi:hypothetical protein